MSSNSELSGEKMYAFHVCNKAKLPAFSPVQPPAPIQSEPEPLYEYPLGKCANDQQHTRISLLYFLVDCGIHEQRLYCYSVLLTNLKQRATD